MPAKILLVDDDPRAIQQMGKILSSEGSIRFATNGDDALRLAKEEPPDLIVLDADMPGMSGFEVCALLKGDEKLAGVPVVFVTSHRDEAFELQGFDVGASDFITKPVNPRLMLVRAGAQLRVKRMADALRVSAATDALTRLPNRRSLDDALQREWLRAQRSDAPLAFILVDVDHFKKFQRPLWAPRRGRLPACGRRCPRERVQATSRLGRALRRRGVRAAAARDPPPGRALRCREDAR